MKWLLILIIGGCVGYFGYAYKDEILAKVANATHSTQATPASDNTATGGDKPAFDSKIVIPEGDATEPTAAATPQSEDPTVATNRHLAKPGIYYMLERVTTQSATGIKALKPGEEVHLVRPLANGRMVVIKNGITVEVRESQVTNDLEIAQAAEKKEFNSRGGTP